jgi:hypothetical protein
MRGENCVPSEQGKNIMSPINPSGIPPANTEGTDTMNTHPEARREVMTQ